MIKVNIYYIAKPTKGLEDEICKEFAGLCMGFGVKVESFNLFNKSVKESHKIDVNEAKKSYTQIFSRVFKENLYKIALSPDGREVDSFKFASFLKDKSEISFFIGGAYGLEEEFCKSCNATLSLSKLTFNHKIAKILLNEQIYRGFCLLNNHPYHK
ncbi:23S rRNA (pseudouridine(1915)-N(3))-methyltransferase RlmH [Helicobacter burdigaliensis]|uniref:23S rRNA (pseudouridine(1915)-N(3))-methyltransferase RlmH n=1 Tax=Helicobacter burdigaliensis TaxID=2315334 RepID=UPI000EF71F22|nr:23S rRNA (pseudouridine(1915)-N(3))-methyltransferase RlmH [Helicobacter burdigaliensis]